MFIMKKKKIFIKPIFEKFSLRPKLLKKILKVFFAKS